VGKLDELVERYLAVWNESDAGRRRKAIAEVWDENGVYHNQGAEFRGHEAIEAAVVEAHEQFSAAGFVFKLNKAEQVYDAVRFVWDMVPASGGDPASVGTQFWVLAEDGRVLLDYQFIDKMPS
jgi:nuclear transport factor 2 (NTF2) superfamily protein